MDIYLGADWSATEVVCSAGVGDEPPRRVKGASRTVASVQDLLQRVRQIGPRDVEVHVVIEAGAPGWVELFHHSGAIVHIADPKQAKAFGESVCSSGAKDDRRDADNLVAMGRSPGHRPKVWTPPSEQRSQIVELGAMHETLTHDVTVAQQRLRSHLREHVPALEAALPNLTRRWALEILRAAPTAWHAARITEAEVHKVFEGSGARASSRARVIAALEASPASWLTEGVATIHALRVIHLVRQIEFLSEQLAEVDTRLDALTADLDIRAQLESVGGIAQKMANRLIEFAFDDVPEHRDQAGIELGACPVFRGSGKTRAGKPKGTVVMRRATAPRARATGYLLGRLASQQLGWAKRMYADARHRGQNSATAYRRIARSLLRILTAMARSGDTYDDSRYLTALKVKGVAWAIDPDEAAA